jgi:hypothetical protein
LVLTLYSYPIVKLIYLFMHQLLAFQYFILPLIILCLHLLLKLGNPFKYSDLRLERLHKSRVECSMWWTNSNSSNSVTCHRFNFHMLFQSDMAQKQRSRLAAALLNILTLTAYVSVVIHARHFL